MVIGNHLTGMILRRGQARLAGRYGISGERRNEPGGPIWPIKLIPYNHEPL